MKGLVGACLTFVGLAQDTPVEVEEAFRYLVKFAPGSKGNVVQTLNSQRGQIAIDFGEYGYDLMAVELPNAAAFEALSNNPNVQAVEQDVKVYAEVDAYPYGLGKIGVADFVSNPSLPRGRGQKVCIVDSGLDTVHEDFQGGTGGTISGYQTYSYDGCNHGTHVAGTIAARINGLGVVGVAPEADLYIIRVFQRSTCSWTWGSNTANAALQCQAAGAKIVSMSLGGEGFSSLSDSIYTRLFNEGVISVAAAGNAGTTAKSYPASYTEVVSVACTDTNNNKCSFSQYNNAVDIAAPGSGVLSTVNGNAYASMSGTSMSTPHVSGAIAAAWSAYPTATASQVRSCMYSTALDRGTAGYDNLYGNGIVQIPAMINCLAAQVSISGDGLCTGSETCENTPVDCGACFCGDGTCNAAETCGSCSTDCGACPICGDATCNGAETCASCSQDCGVCCDNSCTTCVQGTCGCGTGFQLSGNTCVPVSCSSCLTRGCSSSSQCCSGNSCYTCGRGKSAYSVCLRTGAAFCDECPTAADVGTGSNGASRGRTVAVVAGAGFLFASAVGGFLYKRKARQVPSLQSEGVEMQVETL